MTIRRLKRVRIWSSLSLALAFDSVLDQMFESVVRLGWVRSGSRTALTSQGRIAPALNLLEQAPVGGANGHGERNAGADALRHGAEILELR